MGSLKLSVAVGDYDRTRALIDGDIRIDGVDGVFMTLPPEEIFFRAFRHAEFDICELSLSSFTLKTARGDCPYVGVPVFLSRAFRHTAIVIRTDRGIASPADLKGRRIGLPEYQLTACVWARAILADDYGVMPSDIVWVRGGIEEPGRPEKIAFVPPAGLRIEEAPEGQSLTAMLDAGAIDGIIAPRAPSSFARFAENVAWLFPDPTSAAKDYYQRTGIFPIMHVTVLKQEIVDKHPWVPASLMKAFEESKAIAYRRVGNPRVVPLAWWAHAWEEQKRILGPDPWEYGLTAKNTRNLEKLMDYTVMQQLVSKRRLLSELFVY